MAGRKRFHGEAAKPAAEPRQVRDRTSLLDDVRDPPGAHHGVPGPFARPGVGMSRIASRSSRAGRWQYALLIDVSGRVQDPGVAAAPSERGACAAGAKVRDAGPVALS